MRSNEQDNSQIPKDLTHDKTEALESVGANSASDDQNFDYFAQRTSRDEHHNLLGNSLHPARIPALEMEAELQKAIAQIKPNERNDVAREFLKRLKPKGLSSRDLEKQLNLSTDHVSRMTADDVSKVAAFTFHNHPDAFQDVLAEQPAIVKFLSNPIVGAVLGAIATKWLGNRRQP